MTDIISVARSYLGEPSGPQSSNNWKFRCPFHKDGQERRPSFYIHGETGLAFCHTCNKGWSFPALLRQLGAGRRIISAASSLIGIPVGSSYKKDLRKKDDYDLLPEELLSVFEYCPTDLLDSGFDKALLRDYEVGYDHEHERITYSIRDHLGRLVGVSGRAHKGYLIYGEKELRTLIPDYRGRPLRKGQFVWNLYRMYAAAYNSALEDTIVITEGFKACLWCIQCGFDSTIALMGSYLSTDQARLISRLGTDVIVFLDQDKSGWKGSRRCVSALRHTCRVRVAEYPRKGRLQPDDLSEEEVKEAISNATDFYKREQ